jgi:hypothetical protein
VRAPVFPRGGEEMDEAAGGRLFELGVTDAPGELQPTKNMSKAREVRTTHRLFFTYIPFLRGAPVRAECPDLRA